MVRRVAFKEKTQGCIVCTGSRMVEKEMAKDEWLLFLNTDSLNIARCLTGNCFIVFEINSR